MTPLQRKHIQCTFGAFVSSAATMVALGLQHGREIAEWQFLV